MANSINDKLSDSNYQKKSVEKVENTQYLTFFLKKIFL